MNKIINNQIQINCKENTINICDTILYKKNCFEFETIKGILEHSLENNKKTHIFINSESKYQCVEDLYNLENEKIIQICSIYKDNDIINLEIPSFIKEKTYGISVLTTLLIIQFICIFINIYFYLR